jgi:hypothetical protein
MPIMTRLMQMRLILKFGGQQLGTIRDKSKAKSQIHARDPSSTAQAAKNTITSGSFDTAALHSTVGTWTLKITETHLGAP